jgi:hypothetical protein
LFISSRQPGEGGGISLKPNVTEAGGELSSGRRSDGRYPREHALGGRERVRQQGKRLGRPEGAKVPPKVGDAIRGHLRAGNGILMVARTVGCGSGTVQRVKREMAEELVEAA